MNTTDSSKESFPRFICAGAPKCGTTWLYRCLEEHPEVFLAKPKELNFFTAGLFSEHSLPEYYQRFSAANGRASGEFSLEYLYDEHTPGLLSRFVPRAKLLFVFRDPVDRTFSHYNHMITKGELARQTTFEDALDLAPLIKQQSHYSNHIQRYLDVFPREQLCFLAFEEIQDSPLSFLQNVFNFINVPANFIPHTLNQKQNSSASRYSRANKTCRKVIFRTVQVAKKNNLLLTTLNGSKRKGINAKLLGSIDRLTLGRDRSPKLSDATRQRLREEFAADVEQFKLLTGISFPNWNQTQLYNNIRGSAVVE